MALLVCSTVDRKKEVKNDVPRRGSSIFSEISSIFLGVFMSISSIFFGVFLSISSIFHGTFVVFICGVYQKFDKNSKNMGFLSVFSQRSHCRFHRFYDFFEKKI